MADSPVDDKYYIDSLERDTHKPRAQCERVWFEQNRNHDNAFRRLLTMDQNTISNVMATADLSRVRGQQ
ncbi:hypothetical protein [Pendulispora albinea]|uniref:Uncharacterized protein n=1 Tax=Pendulispora albinea TaxID=2741071 RepID=A0ABZ2M9W2_9BACT